MVDKDSHTQHISQQYNMDLDDLKTHVLEMGGLVEKQVSDAIQSLIKADSALADQVRFADTNINSMESSIDEECARILALRQPAASDLRLVIAVSKAITDLERIGDEATKIAMQAIQLTETGQSPRGYVEIRHIGNQVRQMVHDALDSFARLDSATALKVAYHDKAVDVEYSSAMREMVTVMMEDPRSISHVLNVIWALRSLERIGDHARNIAEHVIFLAHGKDVRHRGLNEIAQELKNDELTTPENYLKIKQIEESNKN